MPLSMGPRPAVPFDAVVAPPTVAPGDRVAVVSPSAALPAVFPHVHELGMRRLRNELALEPVEYPTTRRWGSPPEQRADDIHAAFEDPSISAIMATVGGDDQITVLRHLDPDLIAANPKRFFGYSDNTNLVNYLVRLGMVAYHGGSAMVHLGRAGSLHPVTLASTRAALAGGTFEIEPAQRYADHAADWTRPDELEREAWSRPALPWTWRTGDDVVTGPLWGGCLEILDWTMQVGSHVSDAEHYRGVVLFIETSDEAPSAEYVHRTLRNMGERGILGVLAGLLVARPAVQRFGELVDDHAVREYCEAQLDAVLRAVDQYRPGLPLVSCLDIGHTDPQVIMPVGGSVTIEPGQQRIVVDY